MTEAESSPGLFAPLNVYGPLMLVGIALTAWLWSRIYRRGEAIDGRLTAIYFCGLAGALVGAKAAFLVSEGWFYAGDWPGLLSGRSITGGLLGGYAGVELGKVAFRYRSATGDAFALVVPVGLALGRVGCWFEGCCPGVVCAPRWFTVAEADGVSRWPAAPAELAFNVAFLGWTLIARRLGWCPGNRFHVYLIAYGLFRFGHEFLRENRRLVGPISGYHVLALAIVMLGVWRFRQRIRSGIAPSSAAAR